MQIIETRIFIVPPGGYTVHGLVAASHGTWAREDTTKAQVQPAKEGVLDSEYGDTARREFGRRRFQRIPARAL